MTILAVDSDRAALAQLTAALRQAAPWDEVLAFREAGKAVSYAQVHPVDAAFTEIELDRMNGFVLVERLRKLQPSMYIVFVTCRADLALDAFGINANGYLLKPANHDRLQSKLEQARFYGA